MKKSRKNWFLETETDLESITAKEEYFQIEETIKANEVKTKRLLHQRKFKKFNSLKYKRETTREETLQPIKEPTAFKKSYANAVSSAKNVKHSNHIISRNTSNSNVANGPQANLGKLEAQNSRKLQQRMEKYHAGATQKLTRHLPQKTNKLNNSKAKYNN